jgi:chaperonin GroES
VTFEEHIAKIDAMHIESMKAFEKFMSSTHERNPMTTTVHPLHDHVLVKRVDAESKTPGGLIIPDNAKEKPVEAIVIAVGPGARDDHGKRVEPSVKRGDRVLFGKYTGTEVRLDGVDHVILREDDLLAVLG